MASCWQFAFAIGIVLVAQTATPPHSALLADSRTDQADADTDGDGLPDFQEIHKYRTDPAKNDTGSKGVSDGGWQERREFNYSIRAVLRVMPPVNLGALDDDYHGSRLRRHIGKKPKMPQTKFVN
jgi:hypothetical protein